LSRQREEAGGRNRLSVPVGNIWLMYSRALDLSISGRDLPSARPPAPGRIWEEGSDTRREPIRWGSGGAERGGAGTSSRARRERGSSAGSSSSTRPICVRRWWRQSMSRLLQVEPQLPAFQLNTNFTFNFWIRRQLRLFL
jgi:hypothetical protein